MAPRKLIGERLAAKAAEITAAPPTMPERTAEELEASRKAIEDLYVRMGWPRARPALSEVSTPESHAEYEARRARILEQARQLRARDQAEVSKNCDRGDHHLCCRCGCGCHLTTEEITR